jgi:AraC-like DNA-binding protein
MGIIVGTTTAYLAWTIWLRRWTLRARTDRARFAERSLTVSLICQLCGLFLMTPLSARTAGRLLHALTGQWNLDCFAAHWLYIGSVALVGVHVASRLDISDGYLRRRFRQTFGLPMTIIVPISLALFTQSPAAAQYWPDLFYSHTDHWLDAYWTLVAAFGIYLLLYVIRALAIVRTDPRHRASADVYLTGCAVGILACVLRVLTTWLDFDTASYVSWYWFGACAFAAAFSYSAGKSWQKKAVRL